MFRHVVSSSSGDGEFFEFGSWRDGEFGSSGDGEFVRLGVQETGCSWVWEFRRRIVQLRSLTRAAFCIAKAQDEKDAVIYYTFMSPMHGTICLRAKCFLHRTHDATRKVHVNTQVVTRDVITRCAHLQCLIWLKIRSVVHTCTYMYMYESM